MGPEPHPSRAWGARQPAFDDFRLQAFSPAEGFDEHNDAAVDAWIRANSHSGYHLSCTCAMGSVVDKDGKVVGRMRVIV